jgi:hypothetical protein
MKSIPKLVRGDVVEWPDGERAKIGERFRVEGQPTLLRATDDFRVISVRVKCAGLSSPARIFSDC